MTPILVRPVREQFEHDRIIRLLHAKWRRRFEAATNPGEERTTPVKVGTLMLYPDLILYAPARGRRVRTVVEVETAESVNNLEALAQWAHMAKAPGEFHLYVPAGTADMARRLCADNQVTVGEVWTYHSVGDQMRFTMVYRAPQPSARRAAARAKTRAAGGQRKPGRRTSRAKRRPGARKTARPQRRK